MKKICIILVLLVAGAGDSSYAQNFLIKTIAGNATRGFSGDGGVATIAELNLPYGVAVDTAGNIYIADWGNNRIRKVTPGHIISTFAGNGTSGYLGDGGVADTTELNAPRGVAVDTFGNVYIADAGNNRIRKVNAVGIISTFAGNGTQGFAGDGSPAVLATLYAPTGVAVDDSGNVYIADQGNNRIRKVKPNGIILTVAGNGTYGFSGDGGAADSAELAGPYGVAVDTSGNVYIADPNNNRIRKVNNKGIISTIAGNGTGGYSGDGGKADTAELNYPCGVAVDDTGNVYIADVENNRIRKVNTNGIISTIAGNGTQGYSGNGGWAKLAEVYAPVGIAVGDTGNLYIVEYGASLICELAITTLAGIEEYSVDNTLSVYPNPANGLFFVKSRTLISTIEIMNAMGQLILSQQINELTASINLSGQPKGMYFYKVSANDSLMGAGKMIIE